MSISELDLQSCLQLNTDSELLCVGQLTNLKRLNLYSCNISAELLNVIGRFVCEMYYKERTQCCDEMRYTLSKNHA